MLKITTIDENGVEEKYVHEDDVDSIVKDERPTLINKRTGEVVGQVRPGGWMRSDKC